MNESLKNQKISDVYPTRSIAVRRADLSPDAVRLHFLSS